MVDRVMTALLVIGTAFPAISHAAWNFFDPTDPTEIPEFFSQTGFYTDWAAKTVTPEAHGFEVNSPLWSDGAQKSRWLILPADTRIIFDENKDFWDYPNGATFVKLFKHDLVPGDSTTSIWWETRVLVKHSRDDIWDWYGFSYRWNPDGSEARLVSGDDTPDSVTKVGLTYYPKGKDQPSSVKKWHFPNRFDCWKCHISTTDIKTGNPIHGRSVLGFFTPQINRPSKANPGINQITEFFTKGLLAWANKGEQIPTPAEIAAMPRWYAITDSSVDLNIRARGYIAANCSGCHGDRGIPNQATTGYQANYDFYTNQPHMSFTQYAIAIDFGVEGSALLIPGDPDKSIILFRQKMRATYAMDLAAWNADTSSDKPASPPLKIGYKASEDAMPPWSSYEEDTTATQIIAQWILAYDMNSDNVGIHLRPSSPSSRVPKRMGREIRIPTGLSGQVSLFDIRGKHLPLVDLGGHIFAIPAFLPRGLYIVKVGAQSFHQYVY